MTDPWIRGALKGQPFWGYVHGGRAVHARREEGGRVAVCGVQPRPGARWHGSYQMWIVTVQSCWERRRPECHRCHLLLRAARVGWK